MAALEIVLLLVLLIPIFAILTDSPLGRALARRLEGRTAAPPEVTELVQRVELLSGEVDDLTRAVETLKEENQFIQRLLEEGGGRPPLPPRSSS
ncbi:MAG TPA: hypothetical protein VGP87_12355 [Gemmatimonadales bacterium]|jgi:uncharacterized SAM-binding protein YcdF (DUF218 family)|nr:hypothetical protein [Gemmatimonadales bacterium]